MSGFFSKVFKLQMGAEAVVKTLFHALQTKDQALAESLLGMRVGGSVSPDITETKQANSCQTQLLASLYAAEEIRVSNININVHASTTLATCEGVCEFKQAGGDVTSCEFSVEVLEVGKNYFIRKFTGAQRDKKTKDVGFKRVKECGGNSPKVIASQKTIASGDAEQKFPLSPDSDPVPTPIQEATITPKTEQKPFQIIGPRTSYKSPPQRSFADNCKDVIETWFDAVNDQDLDQLVDIYHNTAELTLSEGDRDIATPVRRSRRLTSFLENVQSIEFLESDLKMEERLPSAVCSGVCKVTRKGGEVSCEQFVFHLRREGGEVFIFRHAMTPADGLALAPLLSPQMSLVQKMPRAGL